MVFWKRAKRLSILVPVADRKQFGDLNAIEAEPHNYLRRELTIKLNDLLKKTKLVQTAIGEKRGQAPLFVNRGFEVAPFMTGPFFRVFDMLAQQFISEL